MYHNAVSPLASQSLSPISRQSCHFYLMHGCYIVWFEELGVPMVLQFRLLCMCVCSCLTAHVSVAQPLPRKAGQHLFPPVRERKGCESKHQPCPQPNKAHIDSPCARCPHQGHKSKLRLPYWINMFFRSMFHSQA